RLSFRLRENRIRSQCPCRLLCLHKKGAKRHNVTAVLSPPKKIILIYSRSPDSISSSASAFPFSRVAYPEGCPSHSRAGCSGFSPDSLFNALASLYTLHDNHITKEF